MRTVAIRKRVEAEHDVGEMRQSKLGVFFAAAQTRVESGENLGN